MEQTLNLSAGYARQIVTPHYPTHLSGYGDDEIRCAEQVVDDVCLTCIAIREGDKTLLLYTADLLAAPIVLDQWIREAVTPLTGVPGEHIFVAATHNHSGPWVYQEEDSAIRFRKTLLEAAVTTAKDALADLAPAVLSSGIRELQGLNFVRHYIMEDGTVSGSNFGNTKQKRIAHALPSDPRLIVLRFAREEKPDIVLMNWQAHNDTVRETGYYNLSAGFTGHIREKFEEMTGMHFAYFTGASGNQSRNSLIPEEKHDLDWIRYGHKMAQIAEEMLPELKPVTGSGIRVQQEEFVYDVDHSWDHMLEQANEVFTLWKTVGKPEGDALGKTYGFTSSYQARDIRRRAAMPATGTLELNAFSIGDLGFVTSTNEVFSTVGLYVREKAPFDTVFIISGNSGYLPCAESYDYRSYEADTSIFAKGTAEKVAARMAEMLAEIR